MKDKLKSFLSNIKSNYKMYIIYLLIVPWFFIKFDYYVYSPGGLIELSDRINIDTNYRVDGSFNLTYVSSKNGTLPIILLSKIIPSWDLVSIDSSRIENESSEDIIKRNQIYLKETSYDAIIAAFDAAGKEYKVNKNDVTVTYVYDKSNSNLKIGDIIKRINGVSIDSYESLSNEVSKYNEGDKLDIVVERNGKIINCYSILYSDNDRVVIGINLSEIKTIETNPSVEFIFKNNESGSSRGLMCALEIYNKITEYDLTKGKIIAGTGTIDENGKVGAIDGVKYKLAGAVNKGAQVFIVPTSNYEEAIKLKKENNYNIVIIEADTLKNVIEKLKKLK